MSEHILVHCLSGTMNVTKCVNMYMEAVKDLCHASLFVRHSIRINKIYLIHTHQGC